MNQAIRSIRIHHLPTGPTKQVSVERYRSCPSGVSFRRTVKTSCKEPESVEKKMDKSDEQPKDRKGDVMSHSYGEGYSTRSDEEGFGGIYGGNTEDNEDLNKKIHEDHPAYDKSQGSEVKEKEKSRHQTNAND
ncbi:hypothetical protein LINPERPRIM_LOCUS40016 [Linum perenne]